MEVVEVRTTAMAAGGEAVARDPSGRVIFVGGALPDETVLVEVREQRRSFARGVAVEVLEPSAGRTVPPCRHVGEGCGGCDWQHATPLLQREMRRGQVADVLGRAAGLSAPEVVSGPPVRAEGVRTTVRGVAGSGGRFALRRRRSHEPIEVKCLVAHPLVEQIMAQGRFGDAREVTIRVGARTGERMVVVAPNARGVRVPTDVAVVGRDELTAGRRAWLHEEAAGRRWRISADSFFQPSAEGAEALVAATGSLVEALAPEAHRLVDLCCGVGLFAGSLGAGRRLVGVEPNPSAVSDARHNLGDHDARIVKATLGRWRPSPAEVVVADPARRGLGAEGVTA